MANTSRYTNRTIKKFLPMQLGDVKNTFANINESRKDLCFNPSTNMHDGLKKFIDWFIVSIILLGMVYSVIFTK